MKISIGAVIALVAASASGFSITMSSYLDNLASTATLTSFGSSGVPAPSFAAPAVPAYNGASAPAPASYKSSLADQPESTTINYIGTIGGGSQMKSGPNYTGMSQAFRPTASVGNSAYLENVGGGANGAAAPANGAFAQAPAPAAYQSSGPAPAPYQGASAGSAGSPSTSLNYIGAIGGGSQMKSGPNYTGMSQTFRPSASIGNSAYLENVAGGAVASFANGAAAPANGAFAQAPAPASRSAPAPAPYQGASAGAPASTSLNYIGAIGGGSQMKPGPNYTGMSTSFKATSSVGNSAYLENVSGGAVASFANGAAANGAAAPANGAYASAPAPPAYQSSFTPGPAPAGAAPAPFGGRSSYMPQPSGRVVNTGIGSYLDALK